MEHNSLIKKMTVDSKKRAKFYLFINSGWGRFFLVLWLIWLSFFGYRYYAFESALSHGRKLAGYQNEWAGKALEAHEQGHMDSFEFSKDILRQNENWSKENDRQIENLDNANIHFYLWGILAPILAGCMSLWIVAGFRNQVIQKRK